MRDALRLKAGVIHNLLLDASKRSAQVALRQAYLSQLLGRFGVLAHELKLAALVTVFGCIKGVLRFQSH
jgi:hypothetical protein